MTIETDAPITGAAVIFGPADSAIMLDEAGLRAWLTQHAWALDVDDSFNAADRTIAQGLIGLVCSLCSSTGPAVWTLRAPLERVSIWPTAEDDRNDGGAIITADLRINGHPIRLACLYQSGSDFTDDDQTCGVEAAVQAVSAVTALVNREVSNYLRAVTPPPGATGPGHLVSAGDLSAVLNAVADDLLEVADAGDEGLRDALNLTVNAALVYLEHGWVDADPAAARDRLEQVAASNYDEDLDTILGWIDAGIR